MRKRTVRLQFDFDEEALAKLDMMREKSDAPTRASVIRDALRAYEWLLDFDRSNDLLIVDEKETILVRVSLSLVV